MVVHLLSHNFKMIVYLFLPLFNLLPLPLSSVIFASDRCGNVAWICFDLWRNRGLMGNDHKKEL